MCLLPIIYFCLLLSGVEKKNDDFRQFFHRKIKRWDACTSLLLVEKRQEALRSCERQPRKYVKSNPSFWYEGGKQDSARKVPRISGVEQGKDDEVEVPDDAGYSQQKKTITQSANDVKKKAMLTADTNGHC